MAGDEQARVQAQFTAQVDRFVAAPHVNAPEPVERLLALAAPQIHERVLDVGCGPGLLARAFAPRVTAFVGVDLTPAMLVKAGEIARQEGLIRAAFALGLAGRLPVRTASVDLALTRLALHHMSDPRATVLEIARVLRPGGRLACFDIAASEDPHAAAYQERIERLRDPSHARTLPPSELLATLGRAGLEVERLEMLTHPIDAEDWIARAEQTPAEATEARALLGAAVGTRRFGGRTVVRDATGRLGFEQRWMLVLARRG